jgi:AraC-like DNA-binding protein
MLGDPANRWGKDDPLSSALVDLRLEGTFFCASEFAAPWSLAIPPRDCASFHVVARGDCWLHVAGERDVALAAGDLVLVPRSPRQVLASSRRKTGTPLARLPARQLTEHAAVLELGGRDPRWSVVCGGVRLDGFPATMLLELLPEVVVLRGAAAGPLLTGALAAMRDEALASRPCGTTLLTRLADVLVLLVLRDWIEHAPATGWLAAIRDPQVGRAMAAIHRRPDHAWAVDELARVAGLSRSRFTSRFTALATSAPMHYVTRVQMAHARDLLRTDLTIGQVASRLGYASEPAFARAFKRHLGVSPGAARRAA